MRNRNTFNYVVDTATLMTMMGLAGTGLVVRWVLPPGSGGHGDGPGLALWGLSRHDWGDIHFWLAIATVVLLVLHVALHWTWVWLTTRRLIRSRNDSARKRADYVRNVYGTGFLAVLVITLTGFYFVAQSSVATTGCDGGNRGNVQATVVDGSMGRHGDIANGQGRRSGEGEHVDGGGANSIRGSMTLEEVADHGHIDVDQLKVLLGIPNETLADERLGRLGRRHGFAVSAVRDLLEQHSQDFSDG